MIAVTSDSICFLTKMYSSSGSSYTCRIEQVNGMWKLKTSGSARDSHCAARCLRNMASANANVLAEVSSEAVVGKGLGGSDPRFAYLSSTAGSAACFLTGMYSSSGDGYSCRITEKTAPGETLPKWYLSSQQGSSSKRTCKARCFSFLSWSAPVGYWHQIQSVGYGGFADSISYGVASTDTLATTETWGESVKMAMSTSLEFAAVSTSYEYSHSVATQASQSLTHSQEETFTVTCDPNPNKWLTVWQWRTTLSHPESGAITELAFNAKFCLYGETGAEQPQCPLNRCSGDDPTCQMCIEGWQGRRLMLV